MGPTPGIMPTTLSIPTNIFPAGERLESDRAAWAAVSGLGIAIWPISGGFLIEHFAWSSIFLINIPIVIACLAGALWLVLESRDPGSPRIDVAGTLLSIAGLSAIVWALIEAPERGWGEPLILSAFAAGAATISAFIAWSAGPITWRSTCACSATCGSARRASRSRSCSSP